jgi:hypothetical protein
VTSVEIALAEIRSAMVSGYCRVCDQLVPIETRIVVRDGKRMTDWFPKRHPARGQDTGGVECDGVDRSVS